jgi:protein-tyrosine phosphatase
MEYAIFICGWFAHTFCAYGYFIAIFDRKICVMGLFGNFFSKREELDPADMSVLQCDVHSHLIPGIDDGAQSMDDSLQLLDYFMGLGYRKLITTPHVMWDFYKNSPEIIQAGLKELKSAAQSAGKAIDLHAAAEYYCDFNFEELTQNKSLLTFGQNYVLFELSFLNPPANLYELMFKLQSNGYKPVLAHPERYKYWHNEFDKYLSLKERGVLFQLNVTSLSGHYSLETKNIAQRMIDEDMIDFLGSDCHNQNHVRLIEKARREPSLHKLLKSPKLLNKTL